MPDDMIGVVPNSINVPLLLASIILSQYKGSELSDETMPYRGIWLMTKKMRRVSYEIRRSVIRLLSRFIAKQAAYPRPHEFLVEGCLGFRGCHFRK